MIKKITITLNIIILSKKRSIQLKNNCNLAKDLRIFIFLSYLESTKMFSTQSKIKTKAKIFKTKMAESSLRNLKGIHKKFS